MRQVPSGASGLRGVNALIFFLTSKFHETSVTRSFTCGNARIGSTVIGLSAGSSSSRVMHISFGDAVDFRRARAALAGLAVPAAGEIGRLLRLDRVHGVEHDHALADLGRVLLEAALAVLAAPELERERGHATCSPRSTCLQLGRHRG